MNNFMKQVYEIIGEANQRKEYKGTFICPKCGNEAGYEIIPRLNGNQIYAGCKNKCFTIVS